jgi:hypothetical protein
MYTYISMRILACVCNSVLQPATCSQGLSYETEASCAVSQVRVEAIWRSSVEWQRRSVEASWIRMVLLRDAISGVAERTDVRADDDHWSWANLAGIRVHAWCNECDPCS